MAKSGRPTAKRKDTKELGTPALTPDAQHSYGFDNESIQEQFKELSANGEIAELKRTVERLEKRLSELEAVVSELTRKPTIEAEQATVKKPPAQSSTMSRKDMQDQQNSYQKSLPSSEKAAEIAKDTIAGGAKNQVKKAR